MRQLEKLAKLDGIVRLRTLQLRDAEAKASVAAAHSAEQRALEQSAQDALGACHIGWEATASARHYDHEAASRWSAACHSGEVLRQEHEQATHEAEVIERALREAWHMAAARLENSDERKTAARRIHQRKIEEAGIHRTSERHGHLNGARR